MASFTRRAIMASFIRLLNERPLDELHVADPAEIISRCAREK